MRERYKPWRAFHRGLRMLCAVIFGAILVSSFPKAVLSSPPRGQGMDNNDTYQISPKPCWVDGIAGTCMFVWECIKTEGYHIGMCVDTFMFGSCCAHNLTDNTLLPSNKPSVLYSPPSHTSYSTKRPTHRPYSSSRPKPTSHASHVTQKPQRHSTSMLVKQSTTPNPQRHSLPPGDQLNLSLGLSTNTHYSPGWHSTTEPSFITKVKTKPFNNKPSKKPTKKPIIPSTGKSTIKPHIKTPTKPYKTTTTSTTKRTTATTKRPEKNNTAVESDPSLLSLLNTSNLNSPVCGSPQLAVQPQTRIVGGKNAPFGRWPWQVSVRRTSFFGFSSTHRCGGAILNENWIATAGHCVDDLLTSQIRIRVGEYDFSSVQEELPYVERAVSKKIVHPKYNFFTYEYDLALVQLDKSLEFAPHISPICLPATDDLLIGENATVTGWGRLSEGGTLPSVLQEVQVPIVSNDRCKSMFLRAGRHEFIPEIFLCAGHDQGGQDSCQGDSGGPLQVKGKDGRYFLAGIISWGIGCAEANLPGVCTRISKFVPWILKNVT